MRHKVRPVAIRVVGINCLFVEIDVISNTAPADVAPSPGALLYRLSSAGADNLPMMAGCLSRPTVVTDFNLPAIRAWVSTTWQISTAWQERKSHFPY